MADVFLFLNKMPVKCTRFYEQHFEKFSVIPFLIGIVNWADKFISIHKEVTDCVDSVICDTPSASFRLRSENHYIQSPELFARQLFFPYLSHLVRTKLLQKMNFGTQVY